MSIYNSKYMIKCTVFFTLLVLFPFLSIFAHRGYYYYPDIQGENIVFSSQGSIWMADSNGGTARTVTSYRSSNAVAKISPDGKHIAYSISINGNINIYLMSINGGIPKRLTYYPGRDTVLGFTPDSRYVLFASSRFHPHRRPHVYKVPVEGGFPEMIDIGKADLISFAEDGDFMAFNRNASPHATWKRYKGGRMSEIWAGSMSKMDFRKLTDFEGSNTFPMIYRDRIYFASDRKGRNNLFSMDLKGKDIIQHTFFDDFDLNYPSIGGNTIVFQKAGDIYRYDIEKNTAVKLDIKLPVDNLSHITVYEEAGNWINKFSLSAEAQRVLVEARGNIFIVPVKEGRTVSVASSPGIRFKNPVFNSDGSKIAFFSDETGTEQLYISDARDNAERTRLTDNLDGWYNDPVWSPDDSMIAFSDEKLALYFYDTTKKKTTIIDRSNVREVYNYSWSPCSRYLSYSKHSDNGFSDIYIFDTKSRKLHKITSSVTMDTNPVWDPKGNYLYFLSHTQFSPLMDYMDHQAILSKMVRPHIILLNKDTVNPLLPREWNELSKLAEEENNHRRRFREEEDDEDIKTIIDFEDIETRIFPFPVRAGNYFGLSAVRDKIYFMDREDRRWMADREHYDSDYFKGTLYSYSLRDKKMEEELSGIDGYSISVKRDRILSIRDNQLRVKDDIVSLRDINLPVIPYLEREQIFNEAVRLQRLLFWAPNLGNVDWEKYAEQYRSLLPRIATRTELNMLIGELIGELATSHTYIFYRGQDFPQNSISVNVGLLGSDFEIISNRYRISKIYPGDFYYWNGWSPLSIHPIEEGDYIISVNGIAITTDRSIYSYFENLAEREVIIEVSKDISGKDKAEYKVRPLSSEYYLRYIDWVYTNRKYVEEKSGGTIGYIHIPDMSGFGLVQFFRQFYNQLDKDGLIIDDRYNGGGNVSQIILEKLRRELSYLSVSRHTSPRTSPRNVFLGHLVCLINEDAGSDGDLFPEAFRMYGLGKLIGTKTWGGVVGIRSDKPFVDGGMMTIPEFCNYHIERGWILENEGVFPDIEVINRPQDYHNKIDPQLDKAIEVLLQEIEQDPVKKPEIHPYPDNTIEAWIKFWEDKGL